MDPVVVVQVAFGVLLGLLVGDVFYLLLSRRDARRSLDFCRHELANLRIERDWTKAKLGLAEDEIGALRARADHERAVSGQVAREMAEECRLRTKIEVQVTELEQELDAQRAFGGKIGEELEKARLRLEAYEVVKGPTYDVSAARVNAGIGDYYKPHPLLTPSAPLFAPLPAPGYFEKQEKF